MFLGTKKGRNVLGLGSQVSYCVTVTHQTELGGINTRFLGDTFSKQTNNRMFTNISRRAVHIFRHI